MSDAKEQISDQNGEDGPARNLRRNSAKSIAVENMAAMSDKGQVTPKTERKKKKSSQQGNPSIRNFFKNNKNSGSTDASETTQDDDEEFRTANSPRESWSDNSKGWLQKEDTVIKVRNKSKDENNINITPRATRYNLHHSSSESEAEDLSEDDDARDGREDSLGDMIKATHKMVTAMKRDNVKNSNKEKVQDSRIDTLEDHIETLTKVIIQQDKMLRRVNDRLLTMEKGKMRKEIIITGLMEQKDENCVRTVTEFFKDRMKISEGVKVQEAFRLGKPGPTYQRNMCVRLCEVCDKQKIFKHTKNLRDETNDDNGKFYVNNNLPEPLNEEQKKLKMKVKLNKTLIDAQQQELKWNCGDLIIDVNKYCPKVTEPTNEEILRMNQQQIKQILKFRVYQADQIVKNGSTFIGLAARVHNIQDVITAYQQVKYCYLDATHIMCAYRIADPDFAHFQDCTDGGEFGAGRRILQMMVDESHDNIASFVVRFHNGPNLGPVRFALITKSAQKAIQVLPKNLDTILAEQQQFAAFRQPLQPDRSAKSQGRKSTRPAGGRTQGGSTAAKQLHYPHEPCQRTPIKVKQTPMSTNGVDEVI